MINRIKTIILTILILIAVYQMFELWFDDYSNRNFFYNQIINAGKKTNTDIEYKYEINPEQIVISSGSPQYVVLKGSDEYTEKLQNELKKVYYKIVNSEPYVAEESFNINDTLSNKAILFEYPVRILSLSNIKNDFNANKKIVKQIGEFDKVAIQLPKQGESTVSCFFIDEINKTAKKVKIEYNYNFLNNSIEQSQKGATILYQMGNKNYLNITFLPVFNNESDMKKQNVYIKNPFIEEDTLNTEKLNKYTDSFFENPTAKKNLSNQDGIIIYGDGERTVKYYNLGVIEYVNSKIINKDIYLTLKDAYQIAMSIIEKDDSYLHKDIYLAKAENTNNNEWNLYFGYKIDDYIYVMPKDFKNKTGLNYPIEVTIKNNQIYSYKRLISEFELEPVFETIKIVPYFEAVDAIPQQGDKIEIKDMFLSYYNENIDSNPKLTWMIETRDKVYAVDAIDKRESKNETLPFKVVNGTNE